MNLKWQLTRVFFVSLILLVCFGLIAFLMSEQKISWFDDKVINYIQGLETPVISQIMKFFTFIGSSTVVIPLVATIALIMYKFLKQRSELILLFSVTIGSALLNVALKLIFHRACPTVHRIIDASGYSFPSGHSMSAFTLYGILAFLLWRHIPTSLGRLLIILFSSLMILLIGISRIYLGVHYPSDVLGAYLISGSWISVSIWFYQQYMDRRYQLKQDT